jgi:hypothetical protein
MPKMSEARELVGPATVATREAGVRSRFTIVKGGQNSDSVLSLGFWNPSGPCIRG